MLLKIENRIILTVLSSLYFLIPVCRLVLELRASLRKPHESPTNFPETGAFVALKKKNVMFKFVITGVGLVFSAYLRQLAIAKLYNRPLNT